jgi:uncharacterized protein (TIGR02147 family)
MVPPIHQKIDVFNFFDYCEYLQAVYNWRKAHEEGFSHRKFSQEAGIKSPNYLLRVLKGERSLSEEYCKKFCTALKLQKNEICYFLTLVQFNNETEITKKESLLRSLLSLRYRRGIHRINDKKLQFFSKWYYPVIRELATIMDFKNDYNLLARNCIPRITAQQAENAVNYLLKNGFLKTDESGKLLRTDPIISSGDEVYSTILRNYHKQTLSQSIEALNTIEKENRDISSLTMSVSRKTYSLIKKEIQDFRKHLLQLAKEDNDPEIVCFTGFQLFPRSKVISKTQSIMK